MSAELEGILRLDKSHINSAVNVLTAAFQNYSLLNYYYPDEKTKKIIAHYFVSLTVFSGFRYGEVYATSPNLEGIAVWIPSDKYPITFFRLLRSVPLSVIFGLGRYGGNKMRYLGEHLDAAHQHLAPFPHWFLQMVGVEPRFQGKGYASKLLRPMLSRTDEEGLPCYLDTLDEHNALLYEHLGFKVVDKAIVPETNLTYWAMLREKTS
ncbi:MAG: GNAT family N-acetyltransferase [Dehalococcoidales bacterium]|nr:GNAT family N-acetyltransferase [Dehalococcoidales bacterium]